MGDMAPRLAHNLSLASAYIAASGVTSRYPKITDQIETIPIQPNKLNANGYNPSIVDHDGATYLCYRYHSGTLASKLAGARITDDGKVEAHWPIEATGHALEDPKFFRLSNGQLWMSWIEAYWPIKAQCSVRYGAFRNNGVSESARPVYGQNDGNHMEKGWVWFEYQDSLYFIYQSAPKQVVVRWSGQIEAEHVTTGLRWPYGDIKGGTCPLPYEGKLLRFFHATIDREITTPLRRYVIGACLMNPEPPFETVAISKKPILWGSEHDDFTPAQRKACIHYKPKVVYPGGAVQRDWGWIVSVGVNDSDMALCKITPADLHL